MQQQWSGLIPVLMLLNFSDVELTYLFKGAMLVSEIIMIMHCLNNNMYKCNFRQLTTMGLNGYKGNWEVLIKFIYSISLTDTPFILMHRCLFQDQEW